MTGAERPGVADRRAARRRLRAARGSLGPAERLAAAEALADRLEQLPEFLVDTRVAGYWAVSGELPLHAVFARLRAREQTYHLPVIRADRTLGFAPWQPGMALRNNVYGIPEPEVPAAACLRPDEMDLVLLPLLGFDRKGHRLGAGAGYYDRSFAFLAESARPAQPLLVGIGYHFQELSTIHVQPWDVPLDYVVTDRELIECVRAAPGSGEAH